jgi:hypothetical protein
LVLLIHFLVLGDIVIKFQLLLLDTAVVDLLEISLFPQFVIGGAGLLCGNASLIQILLEDREIISLSRTVNWKQVALLLLKM